MECFDRHATGVLQFSGGKDSLACLHILRPYWNRLLVLRVNTGDALPETVQQMAQVSALVPHFLEVRTDQPATIEAFGWPVEALPITRSFVGRDVDGHDRQVMQPYVMCCDANIWRPMADAVRDSGATLILRGTKVSDGRKSYVRSGDIIDGIEYVHPVEDWTDAQVMAYLTENGIEIPSHYVYVGTSLDCQHCTAYLHENVGKMRYMRNFHPTAYEEVMRRVREIRASLATETAFLDAALAA